MENEATRAVIKHLAAEMGGKIRFEAMGIGTDEENTPVVTVLTERGEEAAPGLLVFYWTVSLRALGLSPEEECRLERCVRDRNALQTALRNSGLPMVRGAAVDYPFETTGSPGGEGDDGRKRLLETSFRICGADRREKTISD